MLGANMALLLQIVFAYDYFQALVCLVSVGVYRKFVHEIKDKVRKDCTDQNSV
jgi:hypothetical protein